MLSQEEWSKYLSTSFLQGYVCVLWFPGDPKQISSLPISSLPFLLVLNLKHVETKKISERSDVGSKLTKMHLWLLAKAITQLKHLCQYRSYSMLAHKQLGVKNYIAFLKVH